MTAFDDFFDNNFETAYPKFQETGLVITSDDLKLETVWLDRDIEQPLLQKFVLNFMQKVKISLIKDYVSHHIAEINALNIQFLKVMDEHQKARLRKKTLKMLLSCYALDQCTDIEYQPLDTDLELRCKAILTLLEAPDHTRARAVFVKKPSMNPINRALQGIYGFYEETLLFDFKKSWQDFKDRPQQKLYILSKKVERIIAFIHGERVNWSFDDTTPLYAAKGIIDSTRYNPLMYSTGLASANLKATALVTDQLSWIAPTLSFMFQAFQLGIEAKNHMEYEGRRDQWVKEFWNSLPLEERHRLYGNVIWALVNGSSFWMSFCHGGSTVIRDHLTIDGLGLLFNVIGMLYQIGLQIKQYAALGESQEKKMAELMQMAQDLAIIEAAADYPAKKADIAENREKQKILRAELRQLTLQQKTLLAEIVLVSLGILAGMILMSLGPFAHLLPAIGSIVNSACVLVFTIVQHSLKIADHYNYSQLLTAELKEKQDLFTGENTEEQRALFLEIMFLENEIATEEHLFATQFKMLARVILIKLTMQLIIFFTISLAPISIALVSIGLGILEAKLIQIFTDYLWEPEPLAEVPEINGGYTLCMNKDNLKEKSLFIEIIGTTGNKAAKLLVYDASNSEPFSISLDFSINPELEDIRPDNIQTYFTKILKITSKFNVTPNAYDFEKRFQEQKVAKLLTADIKDENTDSDDNNDSDGDGKGLNR